MFNYLNVADLWDKGIYNDTNNFNSDLAELKKSNIPINKIIWLYDLVEGEKEEDPEKDPEKEIKEYIEKKYGKPDDEEEEKSKDVGEENEEKEEESHNSSEDEGNNDEEGD